MMIASELTTPTAMLHERGGEGNALKACTSHDCCCIIFFVSHSIEIKRHSWCVIAVTNG